MLDEVAGNDHQGGLGKIDPPGVFDGSGERRLQRSGVEGPTGADVPAA